jgi:4-amino-4-deoxy-L-arabinose transferase-like glycosyltransferase
VIQRSPRSFWPLLLLLAATGLTLRLLYALVVMAHVGVGGDGLEFHTLARQLAAGQGYVEPLFLAPAHLPTADKPPLYPLLLAAPGLFGATSVTANRVTSSVIGATLVIALGLLGRRVAGPRAGLVAAALGAVYPALVTFGGGVRSESLYAPLLAFTLLAAYRLRDRPGYARAALLGVIVGLATLTRSEAVVLVVLAPIAAAGVRRRALAVCVVACLLVLSPWLARNWVTLGTPVLSTNAGGLIYGSNCERAYYTDLTGTWACYPPLRATRSLNEVQLASRLARRGLRYARDHAARVPAVVAVRLLRTWDLWSPWGASRLEAVIDDSNPAVERAGVIVFYLVLALAIVGAVSVAQRGAGLAVLIVPVLLASFTGMLAYGTSRFRVPADVALLTLAGVAIARVLPAQRAR